VLIDARHGLKPTDEPVLKALDEAAVSYAILLTKADQVKTDALAALTATMQPVLAKHPAAYPDVLATSSRTGAGMPELRAAIARLLHERATV
jgi:GTP-binding protein